MIRAEAALLATVVIALGANDAVQVEKNVEAGMRDGVILRADVDRPAADGTFPVLLQRAPYSKKEDDYVPGFRALAARGFIVVQDTHGRYMSDGVARPDDEAEVRRAAQTIIHGAAGPSRLVLPVVPR